MHLGTSKPSHPLPSLKMTVECLRHLHLHRGMTLLTSMACYSPILMEFNS
jgi:hypothetical protein